MQIRDTTQPALTNKCTGYKVKPGRVYKWLERKEMPAHKVGRLWRFKISEVDDWVKSGGAAEEGQRK